MFSPCRNAKFYCAILAVLAVPVGTLGQTPPADTTAPGGGPSFVPTSTFFPGGGSPPAESPQAKRYEGNPQAIADGERLFNWYNCSGCHFHGGGGMGPALMDPHRLYGGTLDQIHESIVQGRPNGMPSWARKIPDEEIWKIAAYVQSLPQASAAEGPGQAMPTPPPVPEPKP